MKSRKRSPDIEWPQTPKEAFELQRQLRSKVMLENGFGDLETIAGIDVSHDRSGASHAAVVLVDARSLLPLETSRISAPTPFPYIPGLLSFREIPVILTALSQLEHRPDLLMIDGHGVAHPRRLGIAAHLGVLMDLPAIGVAKSRLTGRYEEPENEKGSFSPLTDKEEVLGAVLCSKQGCRPLFISAGHKIDQQTALAVTLSCLTRYRLPEPTRLADKLSKQKS